MAEPAPTSPVLATALEANALGMCVIPARADGSKAPRGEWTRWQSERPDEERLRHWFAGGHPGIGIVCGEISGNLEMLELEGVAVAGGIGRHVTKLAQEAGIGHIIERLRHGYFETTPSDGVHWLYRVDGEAVPGNTKIARRDATEAELAIKPDDPIKTLIETRGEGGFTIIAPSHGKTHPSGKPWVVKGGGLATIPTLTSEERDQLHAICRTFDTFTQKRPVLPPVPHANRTKPQAFSGRVGDSWYDAVTEHLAATETWDAILSRYGWRYLRDDRHGSALWCRPGKDDGVGAWVKNDRLNVFSTSTPLDSSDKTTLDRLDVIAAYEHGNDRQEAARAIADDTGIMRAWKAARDASSPFGDLPDQTEPPAPGEPTAFNLPETFWNARPSLQHIRQAAHSRTRCADAVLLFTLARAAATIPPNVVLPAIAGSVASLNFLGAIISSSGGGKSTAGGVARELLPIDRVDVVADVPPGSGEGLTELFFEWVMEEQADGKNKKVKRKTKNGAFIYLDEGQALSEMGSRKGATLMPTLRSAWSGEVIGQSNATQETHRVLMHHTYRMAIMVGFQLEYASGLIDDAPGGTPQRFVYATATDPTIPDEPPEWPGPIAMPPPPIITPQHNEITFDVDVAKEIRLRNLAAARGASDVDKLDTHRDLVRMKVAGLLAYIDDGRLHVDADDWRLAGMVMRTSDAVRAWIVAAAAQRAQRENRVRNVMAAGREVHVAETLEQRALESGAKSMGRRVHKVGGTLTKTDLKDCVASKHKAAASVDDMVTHAEQMGWVKRVEGGWEAGESRPL